MNESENYANVISALECDDWANLDFQHVSPWLAAQIYKGQIKTQLHQARAIGRIQHILVASGRYTDQTFLTAYRSQLQ